jgi:hypothetical protein
MIPKIKKEFQEELIKLVTNLWTLLWEVSIHKKSIQAFSLYQVTVLQIVLETLFVVIYNLKTHKI